MPRKVLTSFEDDGRINCVDIFVRQDGTFGFDAFRADLDVGVGWRSTGMLSHHIFATGEEALREVQKRFSWVNQSETWRW